MPAGRLPWDIIASMSEREEKRGGAGCAIGLVLLLLLPGLYVLGLGPAALLAKTYSAAEPPLVIFYFPLIALAENCRPIDVALRWYVELWRG